MPHDQGHQGHQGHHYAYVLSVDIVPQCTVEGWLIQNESDWNTSTLEYGLSSLKYNDPQPLYPCIHVKESHPSNQESMIVITDYRPTIYVQVHNKDLEEDIECALHILETLPFGVGQKSDVISFEKKSKSHCEQYTNDTKIDVYEVKLRNLALCSNLQQLVTKDKKIYYSGFHETLKRLAMKVRAVRADVNKDIFSEVNGYFDLTEKQMKEIFFYAMQMVPENIKHLFETAEETWKRVDQELNRGTNVDMTSMPKRPSKSKSGASMFLDTSYELPPFETLEAFFDPRMRFISRDTGISPQSWISIRGKGNLKVIKGYAARPLHIRAFFYNELMTCKRLDSLEGSNQGLSLRRKMLIFDTEFVGHGKFPNARDRAHCCSDIGIHIIDQETNERRSLCMILLPESHAQRFVPERAQRCQVNRANDKLKEFFEERNMIAASQIGLSGMRWSEDCYPEFILFEKEEEMLIAFSKLIKTEAITDIVGYNSNGFDIIYLLQRAKTLEIPGHHEFWQWGRFVTSKSSSYMSSMEYILDQVNEYNDVSLYFKETAKNSKSKTMKKEDEKNMSEALAEAYKYNGEAIERAKKFKGGRGEDIPLNIGWLLSAENRMLGVQSLDIYKVMEKIDPGLRSVGFKLGILAEHELDKKQEYVHAAILCYADNQLIVLSDNRTFQLREDHYKDAVSKEFVNIKKIEQENNGVRPRLTFKLNMDFKRMTNAFYNGNVEERLFMARYCLQDAILPYLLMTNRQFLVNYETISNTFCSTIAITIYKGNKYLVFARMLDYIRRCKSDILLIKRPQSFYNKALISLDDPQYKDRWRNFVLRRDPSDPYVTPGNVYRPNPKDFPDPESEEYKMKMELHRRLLNDRYNDDPMRPELTKFVRIEKARLKAVNDKKQQTIKMCLASSSGAVDDEDDEQSELHEEAFQNADDMPPIVVDAVDDEIGNSLDKDEKEENILDMIPSAKFLRNQGYEHIRYDKDHFSEQDMMVRVKGVNELKKTKKGYAGAMVLCPVPGYQFDTNVVIYDFSSLYPSIIVAHYLCFGTIVVDRKYLDIPGIEYTFIKISKTHMVVFAKDLRTAILPGMLRETLSLRQQYKDRLKDLDSSSFIYHIVKAMEQGVKVFNNSTYGFVGCMFADVVCIFVAASITTVGRFMIMAVTTMVEKQYHLAFLRLKDKDGNPLFKDGTRSIYGDTDSIFIKMPKAEGISEEDIWKEALVLGREFSAIFTEPHDMGLEAFLRNALFVYYKKTYCGDKVEKLGKPSKLYMKGSKFVSNTFPDYYQDILSKTVKMLMMPCDKQNNETKTDRIQKILDMIDVFLDNFVNESFDRTQFLQKGKYNAITDQPSPLNYAVQSAMQEDRTIRIEHNDRVKYYVIVKTSVTGKTTPSSSVSDKAVLEERFDESRHKINYLYYFNKYVKHIKDTILRPLCLGEPQHWKRVEMLFDSTQKKLEDKFYKALHEYERKFDRKEKSIVSLLQKCHAKTTRQGSSSSMKRSIEKEDEQGDPTNKMSPPPLKRRKIRVEEEPMCKQGIMSADRTGDKNIIKKETTSVVKKEKGKVGSTGPDLMKWLQRKAAKSEDLQNASLAIHEKEESFI